MHEADEVGTKRYKALDRLAKSVLKARPICPAEFEFCSVFENNDKLAVEIRLQFRDPVDVDNSRAMDTDELVTVEPIPETADGGAKQVRTTLRVESNVRARCLDPRDLLYFEQVGSIYGFDSEPIK